MSSFRLVPVKPARVTRATPQKERERERERKRERECNRVKQNGSLMHKGRNALTLFIAGLTMNRK